MIFATSFVMASAFSHVVQALPNPRLIGRNGNTTSPDRDDLKNLKPVDWHNLLQGSYDPYVQQLFDNLDLNYTHNAVALARSSHITNISCPTNTSLAITFSDQSAFKYIKDAWKVEDNGHEFVVITPTSGCKKSLTESSYWLVTNVTYSSTSDMTAILQVEDLTAPEWAINCNVATENKTYLGLPTSPCGTNFDPLLDSRIGFYDFNKNFTRDLKRFAPGLQSYNESDYTAIGSQKRMVNHVWHKRALFDPSVIGKAIANITIVNAIGNIANLTLFAQSVQEEAIYVPDRISPDAILTLVPFAPIQSPQPAPVPSQEPAPQPIAAPAPRPEAPQASASTPAAPSSPAPAPVDPAPVVPTPAEAETAPASSGLPPSQPTAPVSPSPDLTPSAGASSDAAGPSPSVIIPSASPVVEASSPVASSSPVVVPIPLIASSSSAIAPSSINSPSSVSTTMPLASVFPSPVPSSIIPPTSQPSTSAPSSTVSSTSSSQATTTSSSIFVSSDSTSSSSSSSLLSDSTSSSSSSSSDSTTSYSSSSSSSISVDSCSYIYSDSISQYKNCGDACSTACYGGSCNTYCPSTTSSSLSTTSPPITSSSTSSSQSTTSFSSSSSSSISVDTCNYYYSDSISQYKNCGDACSTACYEGSCNTYCPSTTSSSSSTSSVSTTTSSSSSVSIDTCSYIYSDSISQYKRCGDSCSTLCNGQACNTYCPSTTLSPSTTAPPYTTATPSSESVSSTSSDGSSGGFRRRQDVAGAVAKLGQTLGYKQTPIRESSQAYGAVGDEQGNIRMANQQVTEQVPWNTWGDSAVTDSLDRFLHYFPGTMDLYGVSRLRVADGKQIPEGSSAVALTPIDVSTTRGTQSKRQKNRAKSVYVPLNTRAEPFYPIMCTFQNSLVSKLYIANSVRGVQTLQNPRLRKVLTGGRVKDCGVVSLESRSVAGISRSQVRGRQ